MNRDEFMKELEYLLSDIPEEEKEDALNYYRDYLEEAGEQEEGGYPGIWKSRKDCRHYPGRPSGEFR